MPALAAAGFQVIVPDLRGYGRSGQPEAVEAYSLPLLAGDVIAVLADLNVLFQFPGIAERWLSQDNWANFRSWARHPDTDQVIADLEATGSLTPGLNWYRANLLSELGGAASGAAPGAGPHHGHLEHAGHCPHRGPDDGFRRERGGPVAIRAPGRPGPPDAA